jgi:hypothetical protein
VSLSRGPFSGPSMIDFVVPEQIVLRLKKINLPCFKQEHLDTVSVSGFELRLEGSWWGSCKCTMWVTLPLRLKIKPFRLPLSLFHFHYQWAAGRKFELL